MSQRRAFYENLNSSVYIDSSNEDQGNSSLRLLLVEAVWHYVKSKGSDIRVVERRKDQDLHIVSYAEKCENVRDIYKKK